MKQPAFGGRSPVMRRILCLYLPNWPIQSALGRLAARKDEGRRMKDEENFFLRPSSFVLILHAREARRGDLVVAANSAAHDCGVRLNMPLAEAAALANNKVRRTKDETGSKTNNELRPLILAHDPAADLTALARLARHCERFSP